MLTTDVIKALSSNSIYIKKNKNSFVHYNLSRIIYLSTGFNCCHDSVFLALDNCVVLWLSSYLLPTNLSCHSFTPVFCLYKSVHVHNKIHFVSFTVFIWEFKCSLILQTISCSLKVQSISHNNSASTKLSVTSQIICLCWSICYLYGLQDLALLCGTNRMANGLNWQLVSFKENAFPLWYYWMHHSSKNF